MKAPRVWANARNNAAMREWSREHWDVEGLREWEKAAWEEGLEDSHFGGWTEYGDMGTIAREKGLDFASQFHFLLLLSCCYSRIPAKFNWGLPRSARKLLVPIADYSLDPWISRLKMWRPFEASIMNCELQYTILQVSTSIKRKDRDRRTHIHTVCHCMS